MIPTFWEKPTLLLHQYFFMTIWDFQLNLTPTYSIYLLTSYDPQKGLNLLSLQRLDSYLRSSKVQIGLSLSKKLRLNLYSLKWLRSTRRQVRKISSFGWLTLKTLLLPGLIKLKISYLKVEYEAELRISESNLYHSTNADGNKELRKKLFLISNWGITKFWLFLLWY